jgi:sulfite reductase (NADPH) flavoprotein alpha-component
VAANPQTQVSPTVSTEDLAALQQVVERFDRTQLIWSSGYLAGLAGSTAPAVVAQEPTLDTWHVFYATETGNSRQIAQQLVNDAAAAGLRTELHDLRDTRPKVLKNIEHAVFVLATHGIGEAAEGSEAFFEYWNSAKAPRLPNLHYSILALGDSSYADFCEIGRQFDARLSALGATPDIERVDCDLDFETAADAWSGQVLKHVQDTAATANPPRVAHLSAVPTTPVYSKQHPYRAEILTRQVITGRGSSKDVRHVELDLGDSGLVYQPGDSLGVMPKNPGQVVDSLLDATGLDGDEVVTVGRDSKSVHDVLAGGKEITALSRPVLDVVADAHPELKGILADREQFATYLATRQLIDLVHEYPLDWQAQQLVDALRNLSPRSYSIASSQDAVPDEAHLTIGIVNYEAHGREHLGAASNYLAGDTTHAEIFVEPNDNFRLPADGDVPVIMVGAGTGVAPYRAFIQHRREHGHNGDNWLVFGDRNVSSDFLYQLEWLRYRKDGLLTQLDVAFSRDQSGKVYVQHRLKENGAQIHSWLEEGAHFYVCGDANHMAGDVHGALQAILQQHGGLNDEQVHDYINTLKQQRRYQRDVY